MRTVNKWLVNGLMMGVVAVGTGAWAEPGRGPGEHGDRPYYAERGGWMHGPGMRIEHLVRKLDLSEDQQARVKEIVANSREKSRPLREAMRTNMQAEREALEAGADSKRLKALAKESAETRVDLMLLARDMKAEIMTVLSDEQKQKVAELEAERKERREQRRQKWQEKEAARSEE
jgi:periplasmic protein CpxP/Spy